MEYFSSERKYQYWIVLFTPLDPVIDNLLIHPTYPAIFSEIEENFASYHKKLQQKLRKEGLL